MHVVHILGLSQVLHSSLQDKHDPSVVNVVVLYKPSLQSHPAIDDGDAFESMHVVHILGLSQVLHSLLQDKHDPSVVNAAVL